MTLLLNWTQTHPSYGRRDNMRHLKPRYQRSNLPWLSGKEDMTLCIAAFAHEGWKEPKGSLTAIVMCSDLRIETNVTGSETGFKMKKINDNWAMMIAGNISRTEELYSIYFSHLPNEPIPSEEILDALRKPPQILKQRLTEEYVQTTLAISYSEFLAKGSQSFPSSLFESVMNEIARMEIDCQVILIPTNDQKERKLYRVESSGSVYPQDNFATIGSGAESASSWLHYREQTKFKSLNETICTVLEAKKFCENAPGVGKKAHISIITQDGNLLMSSDELLADKTWKKTGPRATKGVKFDLSKSFHSTKWLDLGKG